MSDIIINKSNYEIVVIGMGYVGLTYSLHLNTFGYSVLGIETNQKNKRCDKQ
jgi:UDP-N-acetyl-D-mannosaminuronate dehydrogenase